MSSVSSDLQLPERLRTALAGNPLRYCGDSRMAPELTYGRHRGPAPLAARTAAVLIALYWAEEQWHLPLTLRPAIFKRHGGQISLPGGLIDPGETSGEAALREFGEELGPQHGLHLLGPLPKCYVFASNMDVTPWIAHLATPPVWIPSAAEVHRVIEFPLEILLRPETIHSMTVRRGGLTFHAPCYHYGEDEVWGATAGMLSELARLLTELDRSPGRLA